MDPLQAAITAKCNPDVLSSIQQLEPLPGTTNKYIPHFKCFCGSVSIQKHTYEQHFFNLSNCSGIRERSILKSYKDKIELGLLRDSRLEIIDIVNNLLPLCNKIEDNDDPSKCEFCGIIFGELKYLTKHRKKKELVCYKMRTFYKGLKDILEKSYAS